MTTMQEKLRGLAMFFRSSPTDHVYVFRGSKLVAQGQGWVGLVFFWNTVVVVPASDQLVAFNFVAPSADRQRVRVQGAATVRYLPGTIRERRNFTVSPLDGTYRTDDPRKLQMELGALLQEPIRAAVAKEELVECLAGAERIKEASLTGIRAMQEAFTKLGVEIVALAVGEVRVEDSALLQTLEEPYREAAQQKADEATAARQQAQAGHDRELALYRVETEQAEARAREELIAQQGANALAEAKSQAEATAASLKGYDGHDPQLLLAVAYLKIAGNEALQNVTLTPDLLSTVARATRTPNGG